MNNNTGAHFEEDSLTPVLVSYHVSCRGIGFASITATCPPWSNKERRCVGVSSAGGSKGWMSLTGIGEAIADPQSNPGQPHCYTEPTRGLSAVQLERLSAQSPACASRRTNTCQTVYVALQEDVQGGAGAAQRPPPQAHRRAGRRSQGGHAPNSTLHHQQQRHQACLTSLHIKSASSCRGGGRPARQRQQPGQRPRRGQRPGWAQRRQRRRRGAYIAI